MERNYLFYDLRLFAAEAAPTGRKVKVKACDAGQKEQNLKQVMRLERVNNRQKKAPTRRLRLFKSCFSRIKSYDLRLVGC